MSSFHFAQSIYVHCHQHCPCSIHIQLTCTHSNKIEQAYHEKSFSTLWRRSKNKQFLPKIKYLLVICSIVLTSPAQKVTTRCTNSPFPPLVITVAHHCNESNQTIPIPISFVIKNSFHHLHLTAQTLATLFCLSNMSNLCWL